MVQREGRPSSQCAHGAKDHRCGVGSVTCQDLFVKQLHGQHSDHDAFRAERQRFQALLDDVVATVQALTPADFYKSMTTHADHRIWQDVYRPSTPVGDIYLKLTVVDDVLIVSFKEL